MKFSIHTLGCKVNQYESQLIRESMLAAGFEEASSGEAAAVCVVNTCTVTGKADRQSRYMIGAFARANPRAKIVVTGCYVEKDAGKVASLSGVSHIVRNADKGRIPRILIGSLTPQPFTPNDDVSIDRVITGFKGHSKAFVKVQDGCENACAYCKVPLVRGPLRSRPAGEIADEVKGLIGNGFKEIVLTGICLGAWGREYCPAGKAAEFGLSDVSIVDLLKRLDGIGGDFRIRLSSIEPGYVTDELIGLMGSNRRFCRHLHIPMQSGDDRVLARMNRPYTASAYRSLVDRARHAIGGLAVTTDVMVGFPGESEEHFRNTLDFVREISPARTHIFTFSRRPGTAAYAMDGAVGPDEMRRRRGELEGAALNAAYLFARSFVGETLDVLVETAREGDSGLLTGYTDNYIKVLFAGPNGIMGSLSPVKIRASDPAATTGEYGQR
jgi:threonylcarbamoyladenosine tRNA methylthiotransferase MtaB